MFNGGRILGSVEDKRSMSDLLSHQSRLLLNTFSSSSKTVLVNNVKPIFFKVIMSKEMETKEGGRKRKAVCTDCGRRFISYIRSTQLSCFCRTSAAEKPPVSLLWQSNNQSRTSHQITCFSNFRCAKSQTF